MLREAWDAEFGSQLINILWVSVFSCQFTHALVRFTVSMGPDMLPNYLDCHIKGTEKVSTKSTGSLKGQVWSPLGLCSYYYSCDGLFSGSVLLITVVTTSLLSEESELGRQTGGHCGEGGKTYSATTSAFPEKKRNCSDFNMHEFFMSNAFNAREAKTPERAFWAKIVCSTLLVKYDVVRGELDLANSTAPQLEREMPLPTHSPCNFFKLFFTFRGLRND